MTYTHNARRTSLFDWPSCGLHTQRETLDAKVYLIGLAVTSHTQRRKTHKERRKTHRFTRLAYGLDTQRETQDAKVYLIGLAVAFTQRETQDARCKRLFDWPVAFSHKQIRKTEMFTRLACGLHTRRETQDAKVYLIDL